MPNRNRNINRMSLSTAGFSPVVFSPIEFKPVEANYGILERSLARQEARQKEAVEKQSAVDLVLGDVEFKLHNDPETLIWFNDYKNNIKNQIQTAVDTGDYATAINTAVRLAGQIKDDTQLNSRIKANQEYQERVDETHNRRLAGQISSDTERWWLANNKFEYKDVIDENTDNIIGGTSYINLETPVADINIADFTKKAFDFVSPRQTDIQVTNNDGTSTHDKGVWVTRQSIIDNLNDILDMTPDARTAMFQRYQVEKYIYDELKNDPDANETRLNQQRQLLKKNGSDVTFEEFCVRMIEQSAISQNLAYDYKSNVTDNYIGKGRGAGSGTGNETVVSEYPIQTVQGEQFEFEEVPANAQRNANASGAAAGDMMN